MDFCNQTAQRKFREQQNDFVDMTKALSRHHLHRVPYELEWEKLVVPTCMSLRYVYTPSTSHDDMKCSMFENDTLSEPYGLIHGTKIGRELESTQLRIPVGLCEDRGQ